MCRAWRRERFPHLPNRPGKRALHFSPGLRAATSLEDLRILARDMWSDRSVLLGIEWVIVGVKMFDCLSGVVEGD